MISALVKTAATSLIMGGLAFSNMVFTPSALAYQPDSPFLSHQNKHAAKWRSEDKKIEKKLRKLQQRFGKKPNIIYILADDVGWGELGSYFGGKLRGAPTPVLDELAAKGMKFLSHYAEPSCTPARVALNTGRIPARTGLHSVLWPGQAAGLHKDEVTIAEVLSNAGYATAMWGKWHLGESPEQAPENQGYDYAHYGLYNGAVYFWGDVESHYQSAEIVSGNHPFYDFPGFKAYKDQYAITVNGHFVGRKDKGRTEQSPIRGSKDMEDFEERSLREILDYIDNSAQSKKPFFIYWATYYQQFASSPKRYRDRKGVDSRNNGAVQAQQHNEHLRLLVERLRKNKIDENTLLVWVSDNGPMYYFWPNSGYSWLSGGKGSVQEGGVRTPGIAYWPGMIKPGQDPLDMIQLSDLFTTAAYIGDAMRHIPVDRVTDGINQTPLLLLGEGYGRRHYLLHYKGPKLSAVRLNEYKILGLDKGLFQSKVYNISRDPREMHPVKGFMHMVTPFQSLIGAHHAMKNEFPDRRR